MYNEYVFAGNIVYILTKDHHRILIDLEDLERVDKEVENYLYVQRHNKNYYAFYRKDKKAHRLHRFIMDTPRHLMVDHINHNGLDDRKANLRNCTAKVNTNNRRNPKEITLGPVRKVILPNEEETK